MIKVSGLTKDYGQRRAVNDLSFSIERGEVVAFLGPNGAGKTTTMRILSGYMPPSAGKVEIGGYDIFEDSLKARQIIGYLPESVPLYPDMTVFEYLKFMAELRHVKNVDDRVDEVLELIHLEDRSQSLVSRLSKGMKQRLGIAQAIVHKPEVLILDEPTIGLDPSQIIDMRNVIKEVGKEHTVLLSTHILSEAQQVCNRVLIINKGQIVAEDTTENLQNRLTGGQRVMVKLDGAVEKALPVISSLSGVKSITQKSDNSFEFETAQGEEIRPQVAKKLVENGFGLLELHTSSLSLEEIFLQLTQDEPVAAGQDVVSYNN
ncbi:MAG: ABC transporter ATP-binding protein [Anaerolineae bacterium]|nr:ABC transporter ATP-binding protein [Anaerolineae bacterium]